MSPIKRGLTTFAALGLLCALAVLYAGRAPAAVPDSAPATMFSAGRAMRHVNTIAARPHPAGSEASATVRINIVDELMVLGLAPRLQITTGVGTRYSVAGRVQNVLVRLAGTQPGGPAVLLMAHYDGVLAAPAAGDDASGTAVLLETLRALKSSPPLRHDVIALFTDAEEAGLVGAAAFVREDPWAKDVGVVLNFEARGTRGPSLMFETGPGNLDVVRVLRSVRGVRATSLSTTVYRKLPNDTDLSELAVLARPALNFAFIGGADRYHTSQDNVAHLDQRSLQHHGNQALALARAFGNGALPRPQTGDAVFFDVPLLGLIVYPEGWALPLAFLALALVVVAIVRDRTGEVRLVRALPLGALGTLASVVLAGALVVAVTGALARFHGALRSGSPEWSGVYTSGAAMLSLAVALGCFALVRRWASASGARAGAMLFWTILGFYVAAVAPGASFVVTWPLIAVAASALGATFSASAQARQALLWVGTIVAVFIIAPIVYLMACIALGFVATGGAVLGVFTALGAWLLAAHLESIVGEQRQFRAPALVAAVALVLFAVGMATIRTNADHPAGASVIYAVDPDSGGAWLTGYAATPAARSALVASLSAVRSPGPSAPRWLARSFGSKSVVPAPVTPFEHGITRILSDSTIGNQRHLTLHVRPLSHARSMLLTIDSEAVLSTVVDGRPVDRSRFRSRPRFWTMEYVAPPVSGFTLRLTLPASAQPTLALIHRLEGLPPLRGIRLPPRPPGFIPIQGGDMTWVYFRIQL